MTSGIQATFHLVLLRIVFWSKLWQSQWKTLTQPCRYLIVLLNAWLARIKHCRVCSLHSSGVLQLWFSVQSKISASVERGLFTLDRLPACVPGAASWISSRQLTPAHLNQAQTEYFGALKPLYSSEGSIQHYWELIHPCCSHKETQ